MCQKPTTVEVQSDVRSTEKVGHARYREKAIAALMGAGGALLVVLATTGTHVLASVIAQMGGGGPPIP